MLRRSALFAALLTAGLPAVLASQPAAASPALATFGRYEPVAFRAHDEPAAAALPARGERAGLDARIGGAAVPVTGAGVRSGRRAGVPAGVGRGGPVDLVGLDFQVVNAASKWCLTSGLTELPCATTTPYRWRFRPVGAAGRFEILNVRTSTCLAVPAGSTVEGARAGLAPCAAVPARRWQLRDSLGETAKVVNTASGKCLQIESGVAVQGSCAGDQGSRRWTVRVLGLPIPGVR
ncbi:RICIN domain-containing protein [Actinoplanes sp. URMC 104]|uniref:RICIN domain-containing protein n=1 Tax=Actinoplanes sp. URMC 104 TaxID=3423409 RepID=UPI003F1C139A